MPRSYRHKEFAVQLSPHEEMLRQEAMNYLQGGHGPLLCSIRNYSKRLPKSVWFRPVPLSASRVVIALGTPGKSRVCANGTLETSFPSRENTLPNTLATTSSKTPPRKC